MQITINNQLTSAIANALSTIHGAPITDQQLAEFIALDTNNRYSKIFDAVGVEQGVADIVNSMNIDDVLKIINWKKAA